MSCCRRARNFPRQRGQTAKACANCYASMSQQIKAEIAEYATKNPGPGEHRFTAEIKCSCGFTNRIPLTFRR